MMERKGEESGKRKVKVKVELYVETPRHRVLGTLAPSIRSSKDLPFWGQILVALES